MSVLDDLSEGFEESAQLLIKLADFSRNEPKVTPPEMLDAEDRAERLWYQLNDTDTIILDAMSADLWYLVEDGPYPPSKDPTDELREKFEQAKKDDNLVEIAWALHECAKLASGVEGARIRLHLWKSLKQEEMARRFEDLLSKLS